MTHARAYHTATLLNDGRVLVCGGIDAEIYDPSTETFTAAGFLVGPRIFHTATLLNDGKVLLTRGSGITGIRCDAEIYDPDANSFSAVSNMHTAREFHTATLLKDGRVLVAGGEGDAGDSLTIAEIFDPVTRSFSVTGAMTVRRSSATATRLVDGRILIVGGGTKGEENDIDPTSDLYDPQTATFAPAAKTQYPSESSRVLADGTLPWLDDWGAPPRRHPRSDSARQQAVGQPGESRTFSEPGRSPGPRERAGDGDCRSRLGSDRRRYRLQFICGLDRGLR